MGTPEWGRLNPELVAMMKRALGSAFEEFARVCEETGLLQKNFVALNQSASESVKQSDHRFTLSMCASAVVSAANHYGGQGELDSAERLAGWALQLEPSHVPALICLGTIAQARGNQRAMESHQKAADAVLQRLRNSPEESLSSFERGLLNAT